ncbi:MAG: ABC transporter substrate-binding protein [Eggerthellaceae bacterium]|nr:ABC transporter substrate-binding protein [Eggerthellaceae bacterium]
MLACVTAAAFALMLMGCSLGASESVDAGGSESAGASEGAGASSADDAGSAQGDYTFTDDLGNQVTVSDPQRVVACMGSFANMWELAGGTLVGVSDDAFTFDSFDIASPNVQKVGDFANINLEAVIALEPDFVIMTCGTGGRGGDSSQVAFKAALDDSSIPVAYFEIKTLDDYLRVLRTLCDVTGRDDLYAKNGQAVSDAVDSLVAKVPAGEAPRVLLATTYSGGMRVQNSDTMTGTMLAELGAVNLADENKSLLSDMSIESIISLDPDFIFVVPAGNNVDAAKKNLDEMTSSNPAWGELSAVRDGKCVVLDPNLFLYKPNALWAESYQVLYDALYA